MIRRAIKKCLSAFGYQLISTRLPPTWGLSNFFPLLKSFGFSPHHIWDVGANRGLWTRAAICYWPDCEYTLIEPQDDLKKNLEDLVSAGHRIRWINAGAGTHAGIAHLYVSAKDQGTSFLDVPRIKQEAVGRVEIPIRTLNEVRKTLSLPVPDMLKIDAEGLDLQVLQGATDLLGITDVVLAEASIGQLDFENSAGSLIQAMDSYGYRLIDITDLNRSIKHGVLWLCEFAFLRKASPLLERASDY